MKLIRMKKVVEITGLAEQTIRNKVWRGDADFPRSRVLPGSRMRVWVESEVRDWVAEILGEEPEPATVQYKSGGRKTKARQRRERMEGLRLAGLN